MTTWPVPSRLRLVAFRAALLMAGLLATLALLEIGVRLLSPQDARRDEGLFVPDPRRAFRLAPGFRGVEVSHEFRVPIVVNSRGLRDREIPLAKAPDTRRILVLGDSFTYGSGVAGDETYPRRLESLLTNRGWRVEVINAGVSGYGTFHEEAFLQEEGWAYQPDLLILQVFPNNDLDESLDPFSRVVEDGFLRFRAAGGEGAAWWRRLQAAIRVRSHAYRFLGDRYHLLRIRLGLEPFYAASLGVYERLPRARVAAGWQAVERHLRGIVARARARGVDVLVVHAPKAAVLDPALQAAFIRFHRADPAALDWDRPGTTLAAMCAAASVPYLDLAPRLRGTGRPLQFYYPHNGHWNARGHSQVAGWLADVLEREGLLGTR